MSSFRYPEEIACVLEPSAGRGGLYISNVEAAEDLSTLRKHQIYAVVTAARGYRLVHPERSVPRYLYLPAEDHEHFRLSDYFESSNGFISDNLKVTNVLVHCAAGISRSAALIIAYLMAERGMPFMQAFLLLKNRRSKVQPNRGFIRQLQEYQTKLRRSRSPESRLTRTDNRGRCDSCVSKTSERDHRELGQTCPIWSSLMKVRPATQANYFVPNTRLLSGSKITNYAPRVERFHTANDPVEENYNPNLETLSKTSKMTCRPQTSHSNELAEEKYGSMRQELDELKENIRELKDKFSKMKAESLNQFGMSNAFMKKTQHSRYAHWR